MIATDAPEETVIGPLLPFALMSAVAAGGGVEFGQVTEFEATPAHALFT